MRKSNNLLSIKASISRTPTGFLNPKLEARYCPQLGYGIFAEEKVKKNELLAIWGGRVVHLDEYRKIYSYKKNFAVQVDEEFLMIPEPEGPCNWINHSCDPNAGMRGQISLVALRPIFRGEEVTFDYAMTNSVGYDEFSCYCGSPLCRDEISKDDWKRPDLQNRYYPYFSTYLLGKMYRENN